MVDYLVKPVDLDELEAVIADTLGAEQEDRKGRNGRFPTCPTA